MLILIHVENKQNKNHTEHSKGNYVIIKYSINVYVFFS